MAITYMRISQLPVRIDLDKNAVPVVLNQSFPIAEQTQLVHTNNTGFKAEAIDSYKYQVSEDNVLWSNEGIVVINDYADTGTPASSNQIVSLTAESQSTNLKTPADKLPVNSSVDRIQITGFTTNAPGLLKLNGVTVNVGDIIWVYEMAQLVYDNLLGGGAPYQKIQYRCGNHLGYDATIYEVTVNVDLDAQIASIGTETVNGSVNLPPVTPVITKIDTAEISKGTVEGVANVQVVINSPFLSGPNTDYNLVTIIYPGGQVEKSANETFNIAVPLDQNGKAQIQVSHKDVDETGATTSSVVTLTILNIDGDTGLVDLANDEITFTANFN